MEPRLTRDTRHAVLGGVAAGLASYFSVDPVLTRLVFILLTAMSGAGVVAYVVAWIIMPKSESTAGGTAGPPHIPPPADRIAAKVREAGEQVVESLHHAPAETGRSRVVAGGILILLGGLCLLDRLPWWRWPHWERLAELWPVILIAIGVAIILQAARGRPRRTS